jgi:hypothetical protein
MIISSLEKDMSKEKSDRAKEREILHGDIEDLHVCKKL